MTPFKAKPIYTVYQPIVEIDTRKILGYEALTRGRKKWRLPEDLFRRSYEEGFTTALDFECLWQAFKILPKLHKKRFLFVNIEPITLGHSFVKGREGDYLLKKFSKYRRQIVFELTQGMKGRDFEFIKKAVDFLKKNGFRFAIDDISGIGSKLFLLLSFKPDFLKIDISLVKGLAHNHMHQDLVHRIVELGQKIHSPIIAEGVERKKEEEAVLRMGIPYAQGFYYARPQRHLLK